jgi:hypothetical protein
MEACAETGENSITHRLMDQPTEGYMMKQGWKWCAALSMLFLLVALPWGAWAHNKADPMELADSQVVIPYYNTGTGFTSFLALGCSDVSCDHTVHLTFYDKTCALSEDNDVKMTENLGTFVDVTTLTSLTEGSILLDSFQHGVALLYLVDLTNDHLFIVEQTVRNDDNGIGNPDGTFWTPYNVAHFIPVAFPDDGVSLIQTLVLLCPEGDLADDMKDPPTKTTTIDFLVFDDDEGLLRSFHNNKCDCNKATYASGASGTRVRLADINAIFSTATTTMYVEMTTEDTDAGEWWAYLITEAHVGGFDVATGHRLHHGDNIDNDEDL